MPGVPISQTPAMRLAGNGRLTETVTPLAIALPSVTIAFVICFHIVLVYFLQIDASDAAPLFFLEFLCLVYPVFSIARVAGTVRAFSKDSVMRVETEVTYRRAVPGGDDTTDFIIIAGNERPELEFEVPAQIDYDEFIEDERYVFVYRPAYSILGVVRYRAWLLAAINSNNRIVYHDPRYDPAKDPGWQNVAGPTASQE